MILLHLLHAGATAEVAGGCVDPPNPRVARCLMAAEWVLDLRSRVLADMLSGPAVRILAIEDSREHGLGTRGATPRLG
jgi:hypothetical protein